MNHSSESFMSVAMFTIPQAAQMTGVPQNTLSTWIKRGYMPGAHNATDNAEDIGGGQQGRIRLLTGRTVIAFAIMHQFTRLGASPSDAAVAAVHFAHIGIASAKWDDGLTDEDDEPERDPGETFSDIATIISLLPSSCSNDGEPHVDVFPWKWTVEKKKRGPWEIMHQSKSIEIKGSIILDVTILVDRLSSELKKLAKRQPRQIENF